MNNTMSEGSHTLLVNKKVYRVEVTRYHNKSWTLVYDSKNNKVVELERLDPPLKYLVIKEIQKYADN